MGKKKKNANDNVRQLAATCDNLLAPPVAVETLAEGDGKTIPKPGDDVTVHYVGTLVSDGSMFDSSREKKKPFTFKLGVGAVIKGWDLGVAQMSLGQRARFTIAAHAAYGAAGCTDKANASGTGVIPPNADLIFDVELLDVNFAVVLKRYEATLDAWRTQKLHNFDEDDEARAPLIEKHGDRDGYAAYLESVVKKKCEAERAKRRASASPAAAAAGAAKAAAAAAPTLAPADAAKLSSAAAELSKAVEAASLSSPAAATANAAAAAAAAAAGGGDAAAAAAAAAGEAAAPRPSLKFGAEFAAFKVEPNDEDEGKSPNFPRSLHNAAEMFTHLGHTESAARLHGCVRRNLATLEAGPDGKSGQQLGRACVCWGCGYVGLPKNAAQCHPKKATPKGVCAHCGEDDQTNFVRCQKDGKVLPWIEGASLTPEQAAKAAEAAETADRVEVS